MLFGRFSGVSYSTYYAACTVSYTLNPRPHCHRLKASKASRRTAKLYFILKYIIYTVGPFTFAFALLVYKSNVFNATE